MRCHLLHFERRLCGYLIAQSHRKRCRQATALPADTEQDADDIPLYVAKECD